MTDLQGAVGLVQLGKLDRFIDERAGWARWYADELVGLGWLLPPAVPEGYAHGWQSFVTVVGPDAPSPRNELMSRLQDRGVSTRPGTHCVPALGLYRDAEGSDPARYPVALELEQRTLALPLHNRLGEEDYAHVVACLREL
jgi:dTDP-4-amino-4,6-dideoxygalactose transaminase